MSCANLGSRIYTDAGTGADVHECAAYNECVPEGRHPHLHVCSPTCSRYHLTPDTSHLKPDTSHLKPDTRVVDVDCIHRGGESRRVECQSCRGAVQVKVFGCSKHHECTLKAVDGIQTCPCDQVQRHEVCSPKRVIVPMGLIDHQVVTNCSLLKFRGKRLFAYRLGWGGATIVLAELDEDFRVIAQHHLAIPDTPHNFASKEDPRLFVYYGELHLMYIGVESHGAGKLTTHVMVAELDYGYRVLNTWRAGYARRRAWEKNWGFFEHGEELYAVYDVTTQRVVKLGGYNVVSETTAPYRQVWTHGELSGGASPILHDGVWYSFFHGRQDTATGRVYSIGCYTFEDAPPFRALTMTPQPILLADPIDRPGSGTPYVVFPCGAMFDNGRWFVSYGYYDQWCRIAEFDHAQLLNSMANVS